MPETKTISNESAAGNPYRSMAARVEDVIDESPAIKTLILEPAEDFSFLAGQFVQLSIPGFGEAPFTPSSSPHIRERLEVTIMEAGRLTSRIHRCRPGDVIGLRGPYGRAYPLDRFAGKEIILVGGGVGLAPLRALFLALVHELDRFERVTLCAGARTPEDMIYKPLVLDRWRKIGPRVALRLSVDKVPEGASWEDKVGVVTVTLDGLKPGPENCVAVVCGPPVMMKFVTFRLAADFNLPPSAIYLSMEKNMSCGFGKCGHCRLGPYFVCQEGPVLTFEEVKDLPDIWD